MKTRIQFALVATLLSVFLHGYLVMHYYPLKLGLSTGGSMCNLSTKLNCDAVSASVYSAAFGIPLALWGAVFNLVLFLMILLSWLEWSENPERLKRFTALLAGLSAVASVVMALVSVTMLNQYCIVCIALYFLSIAIFFLYKGFLLEPFFMHFQRDLPVLWSESKGVVTAFVAIPVVAYLTHQAMLRNFSQDKIEQMAAASIYDWEQSPVQQFVAKPSLTMGPAGEQAVMTVTEFADFRCSHCKHASYSLDAFAKAHPDVRFEFYAYPLDGACNESIQGANEVSCRLAGMVLCAEKENKGWETHHRMFELQEATLRIDTKAQLDELLAREVPALGMNWEVTQTCLNDPATADALRSQAKQGDLVHVRGTPTIFANGRLLSRGAMIPVLQAARQKSLEKKP